jgi:hypothetical protein
MCGSNAPGYPLSVYVMFFSDAQEENYSIDYRWIANFPRVQGIIGHEDVHECCTHLTMNHKYGYDCHIFNQCLTGYQERMYHDASDVPGKRMLYKIEGGGLGDWMRSLLLKSEHVEFISSLVFKIPIKSIKRLTRTMVSSSLIVVGILQH